MFYVSAIIAIIGAASYHYFVKLVPSTINPMVSVFGVYIAVLPLCAVLLFASSPEGGLLKHIRQLNWIQLVLAVAVIMIELGLLLMYRSGWNLSTGSLVTGAIVNLTLVGLGLTVLGEKISLVNAFGIFFCIGGVAMISYRP